MTTQSTLAGIDRYILAPFTVVVDSREGAPFSFRGFTADSTQRRSGSTANSQPLPLVVPITVAALDAGDYSILGYESRVAVERKSKSDLFGTFISDRERGIAQLEKLSKLERAEVVVEADWGSILSGPDHDRCDHENRKRQAKSMFRSIIAWKERYPRVQWSVMPTRGLAERVTYRILERWWKDNCDGK